MQAVYYRDAGGTEPVLEFLRQLPPRDRAAIATRIARLNALDAAHPHLPFPDSSQVAGELRELRCHLGRKQYRVLYRRSGNLTVLLHAFGKSTRALPRIETQRAQERWIDFRQRMDRPPNTRLRPIGKDAP